jgi:hypothetical protein
VPALAAGHLPIASDPPPGLCAPPITSRFRIIRLAGGDVDQRTLELLNEDELIDAAETSAAERDSRSRHEAVADTCAFSE